MTDQPRHNEPAPQAPEERVRKLAMDKSYLQLVIQLMNRISAASGLEETIKTLLGITAEAIGGTNTILYYPMGRKIFRADVSGDRRAVEVIDDPFDGKRHRFRHPPRTSGKDL
ncbi:MAG: hypothetical protein KJ950_04725 [Proteobacteria bacterium]|nr:hypothetical protein [Pseudomonadota bacterium]MBU1688572.1 hypothetical protein [Pseudomonadota bacterium]